MFKSDISLKLSAIWAITAELHPACKTSWNGKKCELQRWSWGTMEDEERAPDSRNSCGWYPLKMDQITRASPAEFTRFTRRVLGITRKNDAQITGYHPSNYVL